MFSFQLEVFPFLIKWAEGLQRLGRAAVLFSQSSPRGAEYRKIRWFANSFWAILWEGKAGNKGPHNSKRAKNTISTAILSIPPNTVCKILNLAMTVIPGFLRSRDKASDNKVRKTVWITWKSPLSNSFRILFIKVGKYARVGIVNFHSLFPSEWFFYICWKTM